MRTTFNSKQTVSFKPLRPSWRSRGAHIVMTFETTTPRLRCDFYLTKGQTFAGVPHVKTCRRHSTDEMCSMDMTPSEYKKKVE